MKCDFDSSDNAYDCTSVNERASTPYDDDGHLISFHDTELRYDTDAAPVSAITLYIADTTLFNARYELEGNCSGGAAYMEMLLRDGVATLTSCAPNQLLESTTNVNFPSVESSLLIYNVDFDAGVQILSLYSNTTQISKTWRWGTPYRSKAQTVRMFFSLYDNDPSHSIDISVRMKAIGQLCNFHTYDWHSAYNLQVLEYNDSFSLTVEDCVGMCESRDTCISALFNPMCASEMHASQQTTNCPVCQLLSQHGNRKQSHKYVLYTRFIQGDDEFLTGNIDISIRETWVTSKIRIQGAFYKHFIDVSGVEVPSLDTIVQQVCTSRFSGCLEEYERECTGSVNVDEPAYVTTFTFVSSELCNPHPMAHVVTTWISCAIRCHLDEQCQQFSFDETTTGVNCRVYEPCNLVQNGGILTQVYIFEKNSVIVE